MSDSLDPNEYVPEGQGAEGDQPVEATLKSCRTLMKCRFKTSIIDDKVVQNWFLCQTKIVLGSHWAMRRINDELKTQIMRQIDAVDVQLRDKLEEDKRTEKHREDIGVTLYGAQQQLAKLQMALEKTTDEYTAANQNRISAEQEVDAIENTLKDTRQVVKHGEKQVEKAQEELNQLNMTIQQVEKYNQTMKDEIAVTRRATYKTEDNISALENEKSTQDRLIDNLNAEIKKLGDQKAMLETQLQCQQTETEQAKKTIHEASKEMENIQYEKKQLAQQLRSSMLGVQRRNTAIFDVQSQLNGLGDAGESLETEIANIQKDIRRHQDRHEELLLFLRVVTTLAQLPYENSDVQTYPVSLDPNHLHKQCVLCYFALRLEQNCQLKSSPDLQIWPV